MTDRYAQIQAAEDLGVGYPPTDDTDDLVGAQKNALDTPKFGDSDVEGSHPFEKEQ